MSKLKITAGVAMVAVVLGALALAASASANKVEEFVPEFANGQTEGALKGVNEPGQEQEWTLGPYIINCETVKPKGTIKEELLPHETLTLENRYSKCYFKTKPGTGKKHKTRTGEEAVGDVVIFRPVTFEYHRFGFAEVFNEETMEKEIETKAGMVKIKEGYFEVKLGVAHCTIYLPEQTVPGNAVRKPEGPHGEGYSNANYTEAEVKASKQFPERKGLEIENNFKDLRVIFPNEGACSEASKSEYTNAKYIGTYKVELAKGNLTAPEE